MPSINQPEFYLCLTTKTNICSVKVLASIEHFHNLRVKPFMNDAVS